MSLAIGMVTIDSADPRPLARWWAERLGAAIVQENDGYFFILDSTPALAIQYVDDPTPGKNRVHLDFTVHDLDAAARELTDAGATYVEKRGDESFWWITMADPQGNVFDIAAE